MVSGKFSRLLQALELRRISALRDIEAAEMQALAPARDEEQRLQGHLEALTQYGQRVQDLLDQVDDQTFLQVPGLGVVGHALLPALMPQLTVSVCGAQELQHLSEPPEPFGSLAPLQWDEDQQLGNLKELLGLLCGLLLEEEAPPKVPAKAADLGPMGKVDLKPLLTHWGLAVPLLGGKRGRTHPHSPLHPCPCLFPRGPRYPGTGPKHGVSTEEETLAE